MPESVADTVGRVLADGGRIVVTMTWSSSRIRPRLLGSGPSPSAAFGCSAFMVPSSVGAYEPPIAWTDAATGPDLRSSIRLTRGGSGGPRGFERRHERPEGGKVATATDGVDLAGTEVVK